MKDFLLNTNGDIMFEKSNFIEDSLEFNFLVSSYKTLSLKFYIENYNDFKYLNDYTPQFILSFNFKKIENDKSIIINENEEQYYQQQIKIRLETPLNTLLENSTIGSSISLYNHKVMTNDNTFNDIKQCVKEALKDILPNAQIQVKKIDTIYLDYSNSLLITINFKNYSYYYYV